MNRICAIAMAGALALGVLAGRAEATALGTSAVGELMGSRDVGAGGGLKGFNDYDNGPTDPFTITWEITVGVSNVHYKYTFTNLDGKDVSNVVFDVSDGCESDLDCITNVTINGSTMDVETEFGSFAGVDGGLKIEGVDGMEGVMYEFDSNRLPVYGDLAVKDGGGSDTCAALSPGSNVACNNHLRGIGDANQIVNFIAVPNGVLPEPTAGLLVGGALLALARRRRGA